MNFAGVSVTAVSGPRGASAGRNHAVNKAPSTVDFLLFPNDTSWFPPDFVKTFKAQAISGSAGALTVIDELGPKFLLPPPGTPIDKKNVWQVIEPGLFIGHETFLHLGGFDESIGTGAVTPWQSGEGTELLLRWMKLPSVGPFEWCDYPQVFGISDPKGLTKSERRVKLRAYARGYGRLLVVGEFGPVQCLKALLGGASFGLRKGHPYTVGDGLFVLLGRMEGLMGTLFSAGSVTQAVNR
ncbi:hypothetical protein [Arthrobacter sp. Cr_A7]|uniref:hypothetical protein n=1 Tax=Arthrobacter sp. Cr_A7 TaxID=3031017 RepID=UPI0023D9A261|nr:hypothetical protein [Arthrobacter sp. Cr_A7]MDF2048838.1 hypothetical protein [Arthrobacter sp. Cr_A7]